MDIFTILTLPIQEHVISFHLFVCIHLYRFGWLSSTCHTDSYFFSLLFGLHSLPLAKFHSSLKVHLCSISSINLLITPTHNVYASFRSPFTTRIFWNCSMLFRFGQVDNKLVIQRFLETTWYTYILSWKLFFLKDFESTKQ